MLNIKNFKEWLSKDESINEDLQRFVTRKLLEYIESNSIEGKIVKPKTINSIS
jgi:hypothetical protein